jgi:hypothetical protein
MISDTDLVKQFAKHKKDAMSALSLQYKNNLENQSFYAGNMMTYTDTIMGRGNSRTMVSFSLVQPYVESVTGFMMQNRRKAEYNARVRDNQQQQAYTKYANGLAEYERSRCNADQIETQQDRDMLICGYGVVDTDISYGTGYASTDPNGDIVMSRIEPGEAFWDAEARAPNLLDATYCGYLRQYDLDMAEKLYDKKSKDFEHSPVDQGEYKEWYPQGGVFNKIGYDFAGGRQDLVNVHYYQWYDIEDFWRIKNPFAKIKSPVAKEYILSLFEFMIKKRTEEQDDPSDVDDLFRFDPKAEYLVMDDTIKSDVQELLDRFNIPYEDNDFVENKKRVYYTAILSGEKVFKKFKSPCQRGFSMKFKTAYWDQVNKVWYGMVTSLRDPVMYYNKALTQLMYTIASNSKGGVIAEKDAINDVSTFEKQWARTNGITLVENGAVSGGKIMPKAQPLVNSGLGDIIQISVAAIPQVTGIDKGFLGNSDNKLESAALQRQRLRQVTSVLGTPFDAVSLYQKEHAILFLSYLRILAENSEGRMIRIVGRDGTVAFEQLHPDGFVDEYDITISEAPTTAQYKEEVGNTLMQLVTIAAQQGANILDIAVDYIGLDESDAQILRQRLAPQPPDPQAVAMHQQMEQLHLEGAKAKLQKELAEGQLKQADVAERNAQTALTIQDVHQRAIENVQMVRTPPKPDHINMTV